MTTLTEIRRFVEGMDLLGGIQEDVKDIGTNDLSSRCKGWNDLAFAISKEDEYADLFSDPYAMSKNFLSHIQNDAENYLKSITITVEAFDGNGDTDLMHGPNQATMFDFVTGGQFSVTYDWQWSYYGDSDTFSADWGSIPESVLNYDSSKNRYGIITSAWGTKEADGNGFQWMPYAHLHGGDPTAMNNDSFIV